jgi:hypothetical protein
MKHYLPLILTVFFLGPLAAQPILSVEPNPSEKNFQVDLSDLDLDLEVPAIVKNLSRDTLRLKWVRVVMKKPSEWSTQVCDNNFCYLPQVSTNYDARIGLREAVVLPPDSAFTLTLHVLPNGAPGEGAFDLDLSLTSDPDNVVETVVFKAKVSGLTTSLARLTRESSRVFPNPAAEYFELSGADNIDQIVVYNMVGRRVRAFTATPGKRYYLAGLPDGLYLVSLVSHRHGVVKTMRLSKRDMRP